MGLVSPIEEDVYLEESGFRRKKFVYDKRVHHSYIFVAGGEVYTVVFGSIKDEKTFQKIGYSLEPGMAFLTMGCQRFTSIFGLIVSLSEISGT
jgi:hypothetical protein